MSRMRGVDLAVITRRLAEIGDEFQSMVLADGASILISARTARIYGPFFDGCDPLGWVPQAFGGAPSFRNLLESGDWNLGGERLWLSPELEYFVSDRRDFWNTYSVPKTVDPGSYELVQEDGGIRLSTAFELRSARTGNHQEVRIDRRIAPVLPPDGLPPNVRVASYRQEITVDSRPGQPPVVPWVIRQVGLGGTVRIPARAGSKATPIVGAVPLQANLSGEDGFIFELGEGELFKAAFASRDISPTLNYDISAVDEAYAVAISFDGSADAPYFEEPPDRPGENGYSAFVFRDDGRFGGYAELEVVGRPDPVAGEHSKRGVLSLTTTQVVGPPQEVVRFTNLAPASIRVA